MLPRRIVLLTIFLAAPLAAQRPATPESRVIGALGAEAVWSPLRFLSDDLLEGRGTGARGGDLAARYIASRFMGMGLEPAGDSGTWYHEVPIVTLVPEGTLSLSGPAAGVEYRFRDDFVLWSEQNPARGNATQTIEASGEIVFVGYGITAPESRWDDYQGLDVRGKILMMLVNDPGLYDPSIFRGPILTYYGRWTYKLEEAARRGAAGVLLVHTDTMATYGWNTVRNSWTGDQVRLLGPNTSLQWAGWVTENVARGILQSAGHDLGRLIQAASRPGFRPVSTGLTARGTVRSSVRFSSAQNVVGRWAGTDAALRDEAVLVTAHYDHLGIGQSVNGDSIMNGAIDNGTGTAAMMAMADAFTASGVRTRRSLVFVAFTGEEKGLLGSQAFAAQAPLPLRNVAAVLNLDVTNIYGPTRDIAALGVDQSTLGTIFTQAARAERLVVSEDSGALIRGSFFRTDHFPLVKVGVPALSMETGSDAVGHPAGWMAEQRANYTRCCYHQVDDEIMPWFNVEGTLQQLRVFIRTAISVGNTTARPRWNASSEFRAAGEALLRR
jgi:Zn-dependent M28 family amino/carboxypeptidase